MSVTDFMILAAFGLVIICSVSPSQLWMSAKMMADKLLNRPKN